jgi:glycosyltransferase involved in cell wall biosynthesis
MELARGVSIVFSVSEHEKTQFQKHSDSEVMVLGHSFNKKVTIEDCGLRFSERRDILFLGAIHGHPTPNSDSVIWFANEVFPRIRRKLAIDWILKIVGINHSWEVSELASSCVKILGPVENVDKVFAHARIFVAPTRFAAGIPHKVHDAASHGLPAVVSHLLCGQLGWTHGIEVLSASVSDPEEFADACVHLYQDKSLWEQIQAAALQRVQSDCAPEQFSSTLRRALGF